MSDYADQDDDSDYGDHWMSYKCKACDTPAEDCGNTAAGVGMLECCDLCNHGDAPLLYQ